MRIAIGCDHRGLALKQAVIKLVTKGGHTCQDAGCHTTDSVDYPDIARAVAEAVVGGNADCGTLICDTGIGMSIAANKVKGIRAALCHNEFSAQRARLHTDANILCLSAGVESAELDKIVNAFLTTQFEGGRHSRRLDKIRAMEC